MVDGTDRRAPGATRRGRRLTPIEHGTTSGYNKHRYRGETPCDACKSAASQYVIRWQKARGGYYGAARKRPPKVAADSPCERCGQTFYVARHNASVQRYCSLSCHTRAQAAKRREAAMAARRPFAQVEVYMGPPRRFEPAHTSGGGRSFKCGSCRVCGSSFVTLYTDVTCSTRCQRQHERQSRRLHKGRRRALELKAFVEDVSPAVVFERDKWMCKLCNKPTARTKSVPHPKAPTVDHVIPLSDGGMHEYVNCQTAHFLCNSQKGNRGGGEQFALQLAI